MVDTIEARTSKRGNNGLIIYIPQQLRVDSKNPIETDMDVFIEVDGEKMTISPSTQTESI